MISEEAFNDDNPFEIKTESSSLRTEELRLPPASTLQIPVGPISRAEIVDLIKEAHRLGKSENKISSSVGYKAALEDIAEAGLTFWQCSIFHEHHN